MRDIEEDKRRGRVLNTPPPGFNPARYASYQVYENVNTGQRIPSEQFTGVNRPVPVRPPYYD